MLLRGLDGDLGRDARTGGMSISHSAEPERGNAVQVCVANRNSVVSLMVWRKEERQMRREGVWNVRKYILTYKGGGDPNRWPVWEFLLTRR